MKELLLIAVSLFVEGSTQRENQIKELYDPSPVAYKVGKQVFILRPTKGYFTVIGSKEKAALYLKNEDDLSPINERVWLIREEDLKEKKDLMDAAKDLPPIYPLYRNSKSYITVDNNIVFKIQKGKEEPVSDWLKEHSMEMKKAKDKDGVWECYMSNHPRLLHPFDLCNLLRQLEGIEWAEPIMHAQANKRTTIIK